MPGYTIESRGTARILPLPEAADSPKRLQNVAFATQPVWLRTRTANQAKIIPPKITVVPHRR